MAKYVQPQRRWSFGAGALVMGFMGASVMVVGDWFIAGAFVVFAGVLAAVARSEVETTSAGVVVRNPFRRRIIEWENVAGASVGSMPELNLVDGSTIRVEGVEPFPSAFPTRSSRAICDEFVDAVNSRT